MAKDLQIKVTATDGATKTFQAIGSSASQMGGKIDDSSKKSAESLKKIQDQAKLAGVALSAAFVLSIKGASDLNESMDKAARTFGQDFGEIKQFADDAANSMGLSRQQALDAASAFGLMFQSAGASGQQLTDMSESVTQLAADLGSLYNVGSGDAQQALISGLVGESEPLRQFNIFLSETAVNAELAREGIQAVGGQFTDQQKVIARYNLILQQGATASGNFIETSDGLANSAKIAHAEVANAAASFGDALLPAAIAGAHGVSALAGAFDDLPEGMQTVIADSIAGAAGLGLLAVGALKTADTLSALKEVAMTSRVASTALSAAMGPEGLALALGAATLALGEYLNRQGEAHTTMGTAASDAASLANTYSALAASITDLDTKTALANQFSLLQDLAEEGEHNTAVYTGMSAAVKAAFAGISVGMTDIQIGWKGFDNLITQADQTWLESHFGNGDGVFQLEELQAAQDAYGTSLQLTSDQVANVDTALTQLYSHHGIVVKDAVTAVDALFTQYKSGQLTFDQLISKIGDLNTNWSQFADEQIGNMANTEAAQDALTESIYGGSRALAANKDLIQQGIAKRKADAQAIRDETRAMIEQAAQQRSDGEAAYRQRIDDYNALHDAHDAWMADTADANVALGDWAQGIAHAAGVIPGYAAMVKKAYSDFDLGDINLDALAAITGNKSLTLGLDASGAVDALNKVYKLGVQNLQSIGSTVDGIQKWADALINVEGVYGKIDDLRASGAISDQNYSDAQKAYNSIAADNVNIQEDLLAIQAQQAPIMADQVHNLEQYTEKIRQMGYEGDLAGQTAALGFMDAGEAAEYMTIQTQLAAAASGDLGDAGKDSMQAMIEGIVATDPYMTAMLEQMGLITMGADGTVTINWGTVGDANEGMSDLLDHMDRLVTVLGQIFGINVDYKSVSDAGAEVAGLIGNMDALNGKTSSVYITTYQNTVSGGQQKSAIGGVAHFAKGGVVTLAELGPEMIVHRSGAIGMAFDKGPYVLQDGDHVQTAASTAHKMGNANAVRPITITGPVYVQAASQDIHQAITSRILTGGLR